MAVNCLKLIGCADAWCGTTGFVVVALHKVRGICVGYEYNVRIWSATSRSGIAFGFPLPCLTRPTLNSKLALKIYAREASKDYS